MNPIFNTKWSNFAAYTKTNKKKFKVKESHPWSKSYPKGLLDFVLLAYFPSIASKV